MIEDAQQAMLIEAAADKAVAKTFAILGIDVNDPGDIEEFRMDLRFSGKMRQAMDRGWMAFTAAVAVAIAAAMWAGITSKLGE